MTVGEAAGEPSGAAKGDAEQPIAEEPRAKRSRLDDATAADRGDLYDDVAVQVEPASSSSGPINMAVGSLEVPTVSEFKKQMEEDVVQFVEAKYRHDGVDISAKQLASVCHLMVELNAVHLAEIFSPSRFAEKAKPFGLKPGVVVDFSTNKPDGGPWDLRRQDDVRLLHRVLDGERPELLIGSPPCTYHSAARTRSNSLRDLLVVKAEVAEADALIATSCEFYEKQLACGRLFLHEAPHSALSWKVKEMVNLSGRDGVFRVTGPMWRWKLVQRDEEGEAYVRKETGWLTNSWKLAQLLEGVCANQTGGPWHRHLHLVGGARTRAAQVLPAGLGAGCPRDTSRALDREWKLERGRPFSRGPRSTKGAADRREDVG
jgi:hypothetical protein